MLTKAVPLGLPGMHSHVLHVQKERFPKKGGRAERGREGREREGGPREGGRAERGREGQEREGGPREGGKAKREGGRAERGREGQEGGREGREREGGPREGGRAERGREGQEGGREYCSNEWANSLASAGSKKCSFFTLAVLMNSDIKPTCTLQRSKHQGKGMTALVMHTRTHFIHTV